MNIQSTKLQIKGTESKIANENDAYAMFENDMKDCGSGSWESKPDSVKPSFKKERWVYIRKERAKCISKVQFSFHPMLVRNLLQTNISKFIRFFPNILNFTLDEKSKEFSFEMVFYSMNKIGSVHCNYDIKDMGDDNFMFIYYNFKEFHPGDYVAYYCKDNGRGTDFIASFSINYCDRRSQFFYLLMNAQTQMLQHMYDYLSGDSNAMQLLEVELNFNREFMVNDRRFDEIHRTPYIVMYATPDCTEVILKGYSVVHSTFEEAVHFFEEGMKNLSPRSKILDQGDKYVVCHQEFPFKYDSQLDHDIKYAWETMDGFIFGNSAGETPGIRYKCPFKHSEKRLLEFKMMGERIEFDGNEIQTRYFYKYSTPFLRDADIKERKEFIISLLQFALVFRVRFEYKSTAIGKFIDFKLGKLEMFNFQTALAIKEELQQRRRTLYTSSEETKECYISKLNDMELKKIFSYLPGEDLEACKNVNKQFHSILFTSKSLWKNIYILHFDKKTFQSNPMSNDKLTYVESPEDTNKPSVNGIRYDDSKDYYHIVLNCLRIKDNWKEKRMSKQYRNDTKCPVSFLRLSKHNLMSASSSGNIYTYKKDLRTDKSIIGCLGVVGMNKVKYYNKIIAGYVDGSVRVYNEQEKGYSTFTVEPMSCMNFTGEILNGYDDNTVYIYDLEKNETISTYHPHSDKITCIKKYDQNVYLTTSLDYRVIGFDIRSGKNVFEMRSNGDVQLCLDWFENYVLTGSKSGTIKMFDYRKQSLCIDRLPTLSPVTCLKCYNRKLIIGVKSRSVSYFDCRYGYFGNYKIMYNHQSQISSIDLNDTTLVTGSVDGVIIESIFD